MLRKSQINFCSPKIETIWLVLCHITLHLWHTLLICIWFLKNGIRKIFGLVQTWFLAGYTSSKIKFKIHQKWSKFIFWIPFFKNQVQINKGTVVNMKVHTDPKNSYMHPFVWQSITVRKSFFTLAKLFSHLIHTLGPWLLRFKKGLEYLCVSWVFLSLCVFFHTLATHGFTHGYLVHAYFCQI